MHHRESFSRYRAFQFIDDLFSGSGPIRHKELDPFQYRDCPETFSGSANKCDDSDHESLNDYLQIA